MENKVKVKSRRATADEPIFLDAKFFSELDGLIKKIDWPYKSKFAGALVKRDRALFAFIILTGVRASEAIEIRLKQIRPYPGYIEVANIKTIKRGLLRSRVIMPKIGALKVLTLYVEAWLREIEVDGPGEDAYLFPRLAPDGFNYEAHINRHRVYQVIQATGKFPHWGRAVCETLYGKKIFKGDAWKLKQFMGLKRLDSTSPYVQGTWQENEKDVYRL